MSSLMFSFLVHPKEDLLCYLLYPVLLLPFTISAALWKGPDNVAFPEEEEQGGNCLPPGQHTEDFCLFQSLKFII